MAVLIRHTVVANGRGGGPTVIVLIPVVMAIIAIRMVMEMDVLAVVEPHAIHALMN